MEKEFESFRIGVSLEEKKTITLRYAINEGIESKVVKDFNAQNHLKQLKSKGK